MTFVSTQQLQSLGHTFCWPEAVIEVSSFS